jgi:hypothetical protein
LRRAGGGGGARGAARLAGGSIKEAKDGFHPDAAQLAQLKPRFKGFGKDLIIVSPSMSKR